MTNTSSSTYLLTVSYASVCVCVVCVCVCVGGGGGGGGETEKGSLCYPFVFYGHRGTRLDHATRHSPFHAIVLTQVYVGQCGVLFRP